MYSIDPLEISCFLQEAQGDIHKESEMCLIPQALTLNIMDW